ncbi:hypothetical protein [Streptomyces sp. NPDC057877]|uniref:hypothetical protein n=1 Tax=Streptomyces sp. NPDC057877 TaxID=3346269 RepID=UPI00368D29C5
MSDELVPSQDRVVEGTDAHEDLQQADQVYTAGSDLVWSVAAGLAVGPFLQAVLSHFGTRLAEGLDERTRTAVRGFLRRRAEEGDDDQGPGSGSDSDHPRSVSLCLEYGWRLTVPEDLPAEGLLHLVDLCKADPPVDHFSAGWVHWQEGSWEGKALTTEGIVRWVWDSAAEGWRRL